MPRDEAELLAEASRGDPSAFTALYRKYQSDLYRFTRYLADGPEVAEELFQETWLRVVRYLGRKPVANFRKWLFVIATNVYRDELRKRRVRRLVLGRAAVEEDYRDAGDTPGGVAVPAVPPAADGLAIRESLDAALRKLTARQREVFVLVHVEGFKLHEVADVLGRPVGTVKSTLHRAVVTLRREMKPFRKDR